MSSKKTTKLEIFQKIPQHLRERNTLKSFSYVLRDIVLSMTITMIYIHLVPTIPSQEWVAYILWIIIQFIWCFCQGTVWMGLWVIAHECGHYAFSPYEIVNVLVGFVLHSLLLVPFFSWQNTHARHHQKNGHLLENETHIPNTKKSYAKSFHGKIAKAIGKEGFAVFNLITHLVLGWPAYICCGVSGSRRNPNKKPRKGLHSHFIPNNNAFPKEYPIWKVLLSTTGVLTVIFGLILWGYNRGFCEVFRHYFGPYLIVNCWLVTYTWLHHTHPEIEQYGDEEYTRFKGDKATIDRNYGVFDYFHHNIGSTHVLHHLFAKIPHYHAVEVTKILKMELGTEYKYTDENWWKSLYVTARDCLFVDSVEGVQQYKGYEELIKTVELYEEKRQ